MRPSGKFLASLLAMLCSMLSSAAGQPRCVGDCDGDGSVLVDEIIRAVVIALGSAPADGCPSLDTNGDDAVTVDEIVLALNHALDGCPPPVSSTPTSTETTTPTGTPSAARTPTATVTRQPSATASPSPTATPTTGGPRFTVVDTGLEGCYDNTARIPCPGSGEPFRGQDGQHTGAVFSYRANGDGTVTDLNTNLMWQQTPDFDNLRTWNDAFPYVEDLTLGGYTDWRLPTIKELLSLADFRGNIHTMTPYLDDSVFGFEYPDPSSGARIIDAQYVTNTEYVSRIFQEDRCFFGYNFADGRIKCYPIDHGPGGTIPTWYVRAVRGDIYGENDFVDNGDGTVSDRATNLMWQKADDGEAHNWEDSLAACQSLDLAGHHDWRLPNVKELQGIVDYGRPAPAIDPVFETTDDEAWFWSSSTFLESMDGQTYAQALYVAFGRAVDFRDVDVHGAGALRSDPKDGDPANYPMGNGPQRDAVRIFNHVRCVRDDV